MKPVDIKKTPLITATVSKTALTFFQFKQQINQDVIFPYLPTSILTRYMLDNRILIISRVEVSLFTLGASQF